MKKSIKILSSFVVLSFGLFLTATQAHADIISPPGIIPGTSFEGSILIIGGGIVVGVVALVSWLVIRAIRKKKNVINK
ncbi:MAG: hypothetical protein COU28_00890 [Candidatus Magasanikbacteria bacterium CG10_big_fil_rev_8_21_14_0_10_36_16]|uniref:Gram-positive cocci surface proteins LPxTG domain-containing protein n=1 Tax=Candidatus Magasanikbacteria bacterium CG10_big_fil_rev_8_21_14_0_10_36_16 TaxID=1974645 RepID=A0A2H0U173_9BACT|nr:MAG: hypothetical protein COU28_00890 [Candidatus Magasanikbacteria bacterium CG10_big_fil_rev_8_21_14_0_10_36_16]